jgi:hypothetical protein
VKCKKILALLEILDGSTGATGFLGAAGPAGTTGATGVTGPEELPVYAYIYNINFPGRTVRNRYNS